jgi:hypothetical protein
MTDLSPEYSTFEHKWCAEDNKCSQVYTAQVCVGTTEICHVCRSVVCVDRTIWWWIRWPNLVWSLSSDGYFCHSMLQDMSCFSLTQSSLCQILRFLQLCRSSVITFTSKMSSAFQPLKMTAYITFKCQDPVPNYAIKYPRTESFTGKLYSQTKWTILLLPSDTHQ